MQIRLLPVVLALSLTAPAAFAGAFSGQAKLANAVTQPTAASVNGVDWRCEGDACVGSAERVQGVDGFMRECRKVSEAIGPLAAYASNGRKMSGANLNSCNKLAEEGRAKLVATK